MFAATVFYHTVTNQLGKQLDDHQRDAVMADTAESLFLVAGPGSGKTTVLTLRVLKLIFVDGIDPATILATTFTRKAAAELRSRILGWGDRLRHAFGNGATPAQTAWLKKLDINRVFTGTLDSIAEQVLRDFRAPGMTPPVVLDEFVAQALLFREGVLGTRVWCNDALKEYLKGLCKENRVSMHTVGGIMREIRQRLIHDQIVNCFVPHSLLKFMICLLQLRHTNRNLPTYRDLTLHCWSKHFLIVCWMAHCSVLSRHYAWCWWTNTRIPTSFRSRSILNWQRQRLLMMEQLPL